MDNSEKRYFNILPAGIVRFITVIAGSIVAVYYLPNILKSIWFVFLLVLYFRSKDEPFWLAFFLVLSDGFIGFFGLYEAILTLLPGLPGIEVGQFYIVLTGVKAIKTGRRPPVFFNNILKACLAYLILLIAVGLLFGLSGGLNVYFRVFKLTLPFLLFYSIPCLLKGRHDYERFFGFIFFVCLIASLSQVFNVMSGVGPAAMLRGRTIDRYSQIYLDMTFGYRGFYNPAISLIGFFGTFYYLTGRRKIYASNYLYIIMASILLNVFLSASRGWMISFGSMLALFMLVALKTGSRTRKLSMLVILIVGASFLIANQPRIVKQISLAIERLSTIKTFVKGDPTAGGTLSRIDKRRPRVLKKWYESPLVGWGFSNEFFEYNDGHVGNANILLHSGICGATLLAIFFTYFSLGM